jgi:hypothetical protein
LLTQNRKSFLFNALAAMAIFFAVVLDLLVLERLSAAVFKLYKFNFLWPSPIYLNPPTVALFFAVILALIVFNHVLGGLAREATPQAARLFKTSNFINFLTAGIVSVMLLARLATLH